MQQLSQRLPSFANPAKCIFDSKGTMNLFTRIVITAGLLVASIYSVAQNAGAAKPAASCAIVFHRSSNASLPSEATFDSFLKKMFGWNTDLTWKIADIKPSEAAGISQATVVFSTPKGQQVTRIYVTPDQKYAFTGDLVPFGADPFADARRMLKGVNWAGARS